MTTNLDTWIDRIKSRDAMTFEEAFYEPWPTEPGVVARLIFEMGQAEDAYTRGKFIELLGETGDDTLVPVLAAELRHPDQGVRNWAVSALSKIGGTQAELAVSAHCANHPQDAA